MRTGKLHYDFHKPTVHAMASANKSNMLKINESQGGTYCVHSEYS